jgi:hypothetical membrane protein/predicted secreted protein
LKARLPALALTLCFLLTSLLWATGPAAASDRSLEEKESGGLVLLSVGERFNLSLGSSPSTGYDWHIVELDSSIVEMASSAFESSAPLPGAGGRTNWTFEAKRGGETALRLEYSRSWEGSGPATDSFGVHIVVGTGNTAWNVSFLAAAVAGALPVAELARRRRERAFPPGPTARPVRAARLFHPRTAGALGLAGILAMSVGLAGSIALYPRFSLWDSNLSELGVAAGAPFFNWGLILCGVLGAFLAVGALFHLSEGRKLRKAGFSLLAVSLAFLAAIGILTEAFVMVHFYTAVAFFALFAVASLVVGVSLARDQDLRWVGRLALFSAAMGVAAWFLPSGNGIAIPELAAAVPGQLWLALLGYRLTRSKTA